ncbi:hypothetical protein ACFFX0_32555 [Citricoccus parietis]|uniref:Uncharacterized protein n=1 Tax=Citricoccus parietis TaxID=592307 RepID=A0ABV5GB05_9MICC
MPLLGEVRGDQPLHVLRHGEVRLLGFRLQSWLQVRGDACPHEGPVAFGIGPSCRGSSRRTVAGGGDGLLHRVAPSMSDWWLMPSKLPPCDSPLCQCPCRIFPPQHWDGLPIAERFVAGSGLARTDRQCLQKRLWRQCCHSRHCHSCQHYRLCRQRRDS